MNLLFKFFALWPLGLLRFVGFMMGWLVWLASPRYRRMMAEHWTAAQHAGKVRDAAGLGSKAYRNAIGHAGLVAAELPKIWCDPGALSRVRVTGLEEIKALISRGHGLMILTPHLGGFELIPRVLSVHFPMTVLYRPARQAAFRKLMETLRPMKAVMTAPANASGVRQLLRALRSGGALGMLPDQVPSQGDGVWASFFGRPAYTMTLPIRLAQTTGAPVVWALCVRTPAGWHLDLREWEPDLPAGDHPIEQVIASMNRALEDQIARAPEQYLWPYNRYKIPRGVPRP
jgi:KDO2-lipid IV(A) lauroyltransferase